VETNFHRSIQISDGSAAIFFTRPISLVLLVITVVFMLWPYFSGALKKVILRMGREKSPGV